MSGVVEVIRRSSLESLPYFTLTLPLFDDLRMRPSFSCYSFVRSISAAMPLPLLACNWLLLFDLLAYCICGTLLSSVFPCPVLASVFRLFLSICFFFLELVVDMLLAASLAFCDILGYIVFLMLVTAFCAPPKVSSLCFLKDEPLVTFYNLSKLSS